jgi:hypothetical protein
MNKTLPEPLLPDKLNEVVTVAIQDLQKFQAQPNVRITMFTNWLSKSEEDVCVMCYAGAVMHGTLGAQVTDMAHYCGWFPELFCHHNSERLILLNKFRSGYALEGLRFFYRVPVEDPGSLENYLGLDHYRYCFLRDELQAWEENSHQQYRAESPGQFFSAQEQLRDILKRYNI